MTSLPVDKILIIIAKLVSTNRYRKRLRFADVKKAVIPMPYIAPKSNRSQTNGLLTYLRRMNRRACQVSSTPTPQEPRQFEDFNGKWMWWSEVWGQIRLDYLIKVRGMDFVQAFRPLWNRFSQLSDL
jgi:hypothetical protein